MKTGDTMDPKTVADALGEMGFVNAEKEAADLIAQGYFQTSRRFRHLCKLPEGRTGVQALADASGDRVWAEWLGEANAGDHWLRVYGKPISVSQEVFAEFLRQGGGTYRAGL